MNQHLKNKGTTKYNPTIDFKFIILQTYLSVDNVFSFKESIVLKSYFFLKQFALKDQEAFGLDRNNVTAEYVPLIYQPVKSINLQRKKTSNFYQ